MSSNIKETIDKVLAESPHDESDVRAATAPHQHDFPYDRDEEAQVTRREFCNFLGLTSAALFIGAAGFAGKAAIDARRTETFTPAKIEGAEGLMPGTSLNFRYPTDKDSAILVRSLDGSYHAFGQKCTHLSCPVYFDRDHQRLSEVRSQPEQPVRSHVRIQRDDQQGLRVLDQRFERQASLVQVLA